MTPDRPALSLRPYRSSDLAAVYDICLQTGDLGRDATSLYLDPWVLGHRYAGPYIALEPAFAFVADNGSRAVGYVLGVPDSERFAAESEQHWFSLLRPVYPRPESSDKSRDAAAHRLIQAGYSAPLGEWLAHYPAHLHIDLLPEAQGNGMGRALMERLWAALRGAGVPGVHLGVGTLNPGALAFYRHLGFTELEHYEGQFYTLGYDLR